MSNIIPVHEENANPYFAAMLEADEKERVLINVLYRNRFGQMRAYNLMRKLGIEFWMKEDAWAGITVIPHTAYAEFASLCARVSKLLGKHGWQLNRSGGRIIDKIWISEQSGSPG